MKNMQKNPVTEIMTAEFRAKLASLGARQYIVILETLGSQQPNEFSHNRGTKSEPCWSVFSGGFPVQQKLPPSLQAGMDRLHDTYRALEEKGLKPRLEITLIF